MKLTEFVLKIKDEHLRNIDLVEQYGFITVHQQQYFYNSVNEYKNYIKDFIFREISKNNLIEDMSVIKLLKEELNIDC